MLEKYNGTLVKNEVLDTRLKILIRNFEKKKKWQTDNILNFLNNFFSNESKRRRFKIFRLKFSTITNAFNEWIRKRRYDLLKFNKRFSFRSKLEYFRNM